MKICSRCGATAGDATAAGAAETTGAAAFTGAIGCGRGMIIGLNGTGAA